MRILHLGFEDHARPGSGGGSYRNHEINRRLARDHEVTVVTARYAGARDRVEDGVRYRHVGIGWGYSASVLSYFVALPAVVAAAGRSREFDLIVEEFAPPVSSMGLASWSSLPTCANVQWFFARQKAREYHLPPGVMESVERWGARRHRYFVALTGELAEQIRSVRPTASVVVNGMGVAPQPVGTGTVTCRSSLFLGRLEIRQKGIDLLLSAFAMMPASESGTLTLAGDGRGEGRVRELVSQLDLGERVKIIGRVEGPDKWRLLASAQVVVMPSRWETFGLVALEAFSVGRPVVAFDIPCLREVVRSDRGRLAPPGDVAALARVWSELLSDPETCQVLGRAGIRYADTMRWQDVAERQVRAYEEVLRG
jgi:glycosyltransferase involved in cell wall biosynthesis